VEAREAVAARAAVAGVAVGGEARVICDGVEIPLKARVLYIARQPGRVRMPR